MVKGKNMNKMPIRVLHVITGMGSGGAESFIMNMYRNIDRSKVQFDFMLRSRENIYEEEILALGGKIYYTASFPKHMIKNYMEVHSILKKHTEYEIIHVHGNALIYTNALLVAKKLGIPCRIMHSHNTKTRRKEYELLHRFNKCFIKKLATDYFACSDEAGKWMFNSDYVIRKNAIDLGKFSDAVEYRDEIRKQLGISDRLVIGNIARFLPAKNHKFLIQLFEMYNDLHPESVLIMVGGGELEKKIKEQVNCSKVSEKIFFLGIRDDIDLIMQAFDVFLLPSLHEGLPVVLVEAQAAGVPCVISDSISKEIKITPLVKMVGLNESPLIWINCIEDMSKSKRFSKREIIDSLKMAGFDSMTEAKKLQDFYMEKVQRR